MSDVVSSGALNSPRPATRPVYAAAGKKKQVVKQSSKSKAIGVEHTAKHNLKGHHSGK